ncbi:MAG: sigma-54-dependent Fis family transcriptional regulator [Desulfobulbaceae bacterium]|nr:MAG: sigma-54-dependent Fis family transcriptional regulator [Desulfobulbaceae bacterium]
MAEILILDDDQEICETLKSLCMRLRHSCRSAHSLSAGWDMVRGHNFDILFLDVRLPDGNGLDLLPELMAMADPPEVIILTGKGDPDGAELAIQGGAWDYILKPSSIREITLTLTRALKYRVEKKGKTEADLPDIGKVIGVGPRMKACFQLMAQAARSEANLLITGETGTGKELFARTIHDNSARAGGKFVFVDCASLTESLVESTLFGHRKGAFTGAQDSRIGLIKLADQGTLFLDEIGEMPLSIQKSFLRVLQERTFRAVGDTQEQSSNFRLIAATNRNLEEMVDTGEFRSDLLFRVATIRLPLPPLRQRTEDIEALAAFKTAQLCAQYGMPVKSMDEDFLETLQNYPWPGNVRELFNIIERAIISAGSEQNLFAMHLPRQLRIQVAKEQIRQLTGSEMLSSGEGIHADDDASKIGQEIFQDIFDRPLPSLKSFKSASEKIYLSELIRQSGGEISRILSISGLSRSHLYALLKKYGLSIQADEPRT